MLRLRVAICSGWLKISIVQVLVSCLAVVFDPPGGSYQIRGALERVAPSGECVQRRLAPCDTRPPPGNLEANFAWRLKSNVKR